MVYRQGVFQMSEKSPNLTGAAVGREAGIKEASPALRRNWAKKDL